MLRRFTQLTIAISSILGLCAGLAIAEKPARQRPSQITPTGAEDAVQVGEDDGSRKLDALTSEATEGLTVVERADGTQMVDLQGRFQHVLKANQTADGKHDVSCNVDAKLVDAKGKPLPAWTPRKGRGVQLAVKPLRAPIKVVKPARALEVK